MKQFPLTLDWLNFVLVYTRACYEAISVDTRLVKFCIGIHSSILTKKQTIDSRLVDFCVSVGTHTSLLLGSHVCKDSAGKQSSILRNKQLTLGWLTFVVGKHSSILLGSHVCECWGFT